MVNGRLPASARPERSMILPGAQAPGGAEVRAEWFKQLGQRIGVGIGVAVFVLIGINSTIRTSGLIPKDAVVVVVLDSEDGYYRSLYSRSWDDFKQPPLIDFLTWEEATDHGFDPYPQDLKDGLFRDAESTGVIRNLLASWGVLPPVRRWIVWPMGEKPRWDDGSPLAGREGERLASVRDR
jgi:hypothetical protein